MLNCLYVSYSNQHSITKGKEFDGVDDTNYINCMTVTAEQQLDSKNHENINWIKQHMLQGQQWNGNAFGSSTNSSKDTPNALIFAVLLYNMLAQSENVTHFSKWKMSPLLH